jgi:endonuclease YncB( thermonuclease family)
MFRSLHKIFLLFCWLVVVGLAGILYQHRSLFFPLVDLVDALRAGEGLEQKKTGELSGEVTRILDGDMFVLRDEHNRTYTIRLTGVDAPDYPGTNRSELHRALESKTNLRHLILSNQVRVELTYTNDSRGALGLVYLGDTNINVLAVEAGIARAAREQMNGLPLKDRYALIRAERKARENEKAEFRIPNVEGSPNP